MFKQLFNLLPFLGTQLLGMLATRATIPAADQPAVLAAANAQLPAEQQLNDAQLMAVDQAIILYLEGKVEAQITPRA